MTQIDVSEDMRAKLLEATLKHVPFDGWTDKALRAGVASCDLPEGAQDLYFPGGALEMINFWSARCDALAQDSLAAIDLSEMKVRQKVTAGVIARFEAIGPHEQAAHRALAKLALPSSAASGAQNLWASADMIWRAIGDTSTDGNYYSKRAVLSAVIGSSVIPWLSDENEGKPDARCFIDGRIENVMQFEKFKAKARGLTDHLPDPVKMLSKLRYGSTRTRRYQRR